MQPQDPKTPNPNVPEQPDQSTPQTPPAPEPPAALTPTPAAAPAPAPAPTLQPEASQFAGPTGGMPQPSKPGLSKKAILAFLITFFVAAAAVSISLMFFNGIKLATYTGDKYSVQYPEGYEQKDSDEGMTFTEKGEQGTASAVFVYYAEFPQRIEQDELDALTEEFKNQVESNISGLAGGTTGQVKDIKITDTQFKGQKALEITGKGVQDGKDAGDLKIMAVIDTEKIYMVGVGAHASDPGVSSAMNQIINSFTLK